MALYRCPECGQDKEFKARCYVTYREAILDGGGAWIEDLGEFDSELAEGSDIECPDCGHVASCDAFWND